MKKSAVTAIVFGFSIIVLIFTIITFGYNTELEKTIARKDEIIKKTQQRDSILGRSTKKYAETITQYVTNCSFKVNDEIITAEELVNVLSNTENKYERTKDSLKAYKNAIDEVRNIYRENDKLLIDKIRNLDDSLAIHQTLLKRLKRDYGITYTVKNEGNAGIINVPLNKADSALVIYKYYKHKLSGDSEGNFVIETESKDEKTSKKRRN